GFASIDPAYPEQEHQREIAVAALIQASARFGDSRPFLLAGVGEYLTMHRLRYYGGGSDHRLDHAPGLSVGAGISGSTKFAPVLQVRWHRIFANSDPYVSAVKTT